MTQDLTIIKALIKADYERKVKAFRSLPIEHKNIIAGDSMIAYMNLNHYGFDEWMNMGIAGDTTEGLMNRLNEIKRQFPKKVIISIGSNDLVLTTLNQQGIIEHIKKIYDELSKESEVYVLSLTPVNDLLPISNHTFIANRRNKDIQDINQQLKAYFQTCFIDVSSELLDAHLLLREELTKDGIHLNHEGYLIYAKNIKKQLIKTL